jgi:hypothetical protein
MELTSFESKERAAASAKGASYEIDLPERLFCPQIYWDFALSI